MRVRVVESTPLRRFAPIIGLVVFVTAALAVLDWAGAAYLRRHDARYEKVIVGERTRLANYRRAVIFAEPVRQNAAAWYRSVFANLNSLPPDTANNLRPRTDQGATSVPLSVRARFQDRCREMRSSEILEAFRSTYCEWQLGYHLDSSTVLDYLPAANILAYCKMLEGDSRAEQHDWRGAARSYLETASFGSDMDQGMFGMNLAGLSSTQFGLEALGRLVGAVDDKAVLSVIWTELSKLGGRMPTLNQGLRFVRIWFATRLADEAQRYVAIHQRGIGRIVPWQAIAAWGVSRQGSLLSHLDQAIEVSDPAERQELAKAIHRDIARGQDSDMIVAAELPARWHELTSEASKLDRLYGAVLVAIKLQEWYLDNGIYPDDGSQLQWPVRALHVQYLRSDDGEGYKLVAAKEDGTSVIILERSVAVQ